MSDNNKSAKIHFEFLAEVAKAFQNVAEKQKKGTESDSTSGDLTGTP